MNFLLMKKNAGRIATGLAVACQLIALFMAVILVLILMGRIQLTIVTPDAYYENALLLESDHAATSRIMYTRISSQELRLYTDGSIGFWTWLAVALIGAAKILPMGISALFMAGFFGNIAEGNVFTQPNAARLTRSGMVTAATALLTPFLNVYVFPLLVNCFTANELSVAATFDLTGLMTGGVLLVMAYVFRYGLYLQEEADHTL